MGTLKSFWQSKTIYRKIMLILVAFHLLGCFVLPLAKLHGTASTLNTWMDRMGVGSFPENLTLFNLIRLINDLGGSDGMFYTTVIIANVVILVIQLFGKKRASYVATLVIWGIFSIFEYPALGAADSIRVYEFSAAGVLLVMVSIAISVVSIIGIIMEVKAQIKMAERAIMAPTAAPTAAASAQPGMQGTGVSPSFKIDPEKMEKMKEQAGNIADTTAAVARKAAKAAVKGMYKASDAVKGFVEDAKNENGAQRVQPQATPPQQMYQQAPSQQMYQQAQPQQMYQQAPSQQVYQQAQPQQMYQQAPSQQMYQQSTPSQYAAAPAAAFEDMQTVALDQAFPGMQAAPAENNVIPQTGAVTGIQGMFAGAQIPLGSGEEMIIGRGSEICHIILEGAAVSRKHCVVAYDGTTGNYLVTDYSSNGTYVGNGGRLPANKTLSLSPGTVIYIGNEENAFRLG